ncbi:Epoxide hydrolase [Minicystis rosea]|nr:Epoxide hydrolase [Minicystis rosea]
MAHADDIDLPDVTLEVASHGEGPVVIAAHGFPDDASTFRAQIPALTAAGYQVLVPTMRGYAKSGIPRSGRYDLPALGGDLLALADRFSPDAPVRLLGHDWGAAAAYAAAALAPARVSHLAALAVPHPAAFLRAFTRAAQMRRSWYMLFFQLRYVADAALRRDDLALVDRLWRDWSPSYRASADEMARVKAGIRDRIGPVLGYYRAIPGALARASMRRVLAPATVPTLRLQGAEDGCIGAEVGEDEARFHAARFEAHVIPSAGHFLQRERPEDVNRLLLSFFGAP